MGHLSSYKYYFAYFITKLPGRQDTRCSPVRRNREYTDTKTSSANHASILYILILTRNSYYFQIPKIPWMFPMKNPPLFWAFARIYTNATNIPDRLYRCSTCTVLTGFQMHDIWNILKTQTSRYLQESDLLFWPGAKIVSSPVMVIVSPLFTEVYGEI